MCVCVRSLCCCTSKRSFKSILKSVEKHVNKSTSSTPGLHNYHLFVYTFTCVCICVCYTYFCVENNFSPAKFNAKPLQLAVRPFSPPAFDQIYLFAFTIKVFLYKICVYTPQVRCEILIFSSLVGGVLLKTKISKQFRFQFPQFNSWAISKI